MHAASIGLGARSALCAACAAVHGLQNCALFIPVSLSLCVALLVSVRTSLDANLRAHRGSRKHSWLRRESAECKGTQAYTGTSMGIAACLLCLRYGRHGLLCIVAGRTGFRAHPEGACPVPGAAPTTATPSSPSAAS